MENQVSLAERIRELRDRAGLTQRELAEKVAVTSGFITQIETGNRQPSLDVLLRLIAAMKLSRAEEDELVLLYERAQQNKMQRVVQTRGAAARNAIVRTRGGATHAPLTPVDEQATVAAQRIAAELDADPELTEAYRYLIAAMANRQMRETVLNALRAFAKVSNPAAQPEDHR